MAQNTGHKIILIADDDPTIRELYSSELEKGGYIIQLASDGVEALELIQQNKPDLILLDIMMPRKSGLDVLSELKQNSSLMNIPIFVLSALGDTDDKARGLALGALRYIAKAETIPGKVIQEVDDFFAGQSE